MRLGVDYGGTNLKMGMFDESGAEIRFREDRLEPFTRGGDVASNIVDHLRAFAGADRPASVGFASKGLVNRSQGIIEQDIGAGSLIAGVPLGQLLSHAFGVPVVLENDARAYAWGEWRFGAGRGSRLLVCMTFGTGVGAAVIADGRPYEGTDPAGGLLGGHLTIDRNGPPCPCGNRGCLERYCSATAMHEVVSRRHPELETRGRDALESFFAAADKGPSPYRETLEEFQDAMALGIVNVIHAYGPDAVVLGGGLMLSGGVFLPGVQHRVDRMAWTFPRGKIRLRTAALGNRAAAMGVAFHPELA